MMLSCKALRSTFICVSAVNMRECNKCMACSANIKGWAFHAEKDWNKGKAQLKRMMTDGISCAMFSFSCRKKYSKAI